VKLIAYIDGSSQGNPGESGYGVVLKRDDGHVLETFGRYIGSGTNNTAEYQGLLGCLKRIGKYKPSSVTVYSDSQLLVNQINGTYRVKKSHLKILHSHVMEVLGALSIEFRIFYIAREKNKEADRLARQAICLRSEVKGEVRGDFGDPPGQDG